MPNSSPGFQPDSSSALGRSTSMQWQEKARKVTKQAGDPHMPTPTSHHHPKHQLVGGTFCCMKNFIPDTFLPAGLLHFPDHIPTLMSRAATAAMRSCSVCPCQQPCSGARRGVPGCPGVLAPAPAGPARPCLCYIHNSCTVNPASKK